MTSAWTLKPVTFPIPPEIQVPHIPQRNGRFHRFPGIHENAPPQIDYDYDFSPRSIIFSPDDSCIARLVEPLNIVINKFSTIDNSSKSIPTSIKVGPKQHNGLIDDLKSSTSLPIDKCSSSLSDTTIMLGENKIIRCPEAITAMTFGPKKAVKSYYRYNEESNGSNNAENQNEETLQSSATYLLVTGHKNGNIRFWDTESGRLVTTLSSHKSQVNALAFSPLPNSQNTSTYNDDSLLRLISVGSDLALKVWECEYYGYNMFQSIPHSQPLWCCDYSPCGNLVAAAGTGKCIFMYDTASSNSGNMELRLRIQGHLSNIVGCKFSPDSALLVTASWDTKVNIWDCHSGELKRSLCHIVPPPQLVFSPNIRALSLNKFSTAISTVTTEGKLIIWNPFETHQQYISEVNNEPNETRIENEIPELRIDVKDEGYLSCQFSSHGNLIAVADQCGYAYVYEVCMPLPKLSQFCRNVIRKQLSTVMTNGGKSVMTMAEKINEISCIPKSIKSFLSYDSFI